MDAKEVATLLVNPLAFLNSLVIPSGHGPRHFRDVMADFQRRDFHAVIPALQALKKSAQPTPSRFWFERTKGASKDSDLAALLLWLLASSQRSLTIQIGAADQSQADELRKAAKDILRLNPWIEHFVKINAFSLINQNSGSKADILTADSEGSHGSRPDLLIVNELTHVSRREFAETLLDNASKMPRGVVIIATNAGHIDTWQEEWRKIAQESERWHFAAYTEPAPWLHPKDLTEARRRNGPNRYARLWQGQWVGQSGNALNPADLAAAICVEGPPPHDRKLRYIGSLDLGISSDATAFLVLAKEPTGPRTWLTHTKKWLPQPGHRIKIEEVEAEIHRFHSRTPLDVLAYDNWQAIYLGERLRKAGINAEEMPFVPKNLQAMASAVVQSFGDGNIFLYDDPELIADLKQLKIIEKSYGLRLDSQRGKTGHADLAIALAIALATAHEFRPAFTIRDHNEYDGLPSIRELLGDEFADDEPERGWQRISGPDPSISNHAPAESSRWWIPQKATE